MRVCGLRVRVCVRGRRAVTASLPAIDHLQQQAAWLAPARARLLRHLGIARRRRVLDLGAGYGAVTEELTRRAGGPVTALDLDYRALRHVPSAAPVQAHSAWLPFPAGAFDLVVCHFALLWMPLAETLAEIARVLDAGGALAALEPDYGGLLEAPPETAVRGVWLAALARAGADPLIGRRLAGPLAALGFQVRVELLNDLAPADPARFDFLRGLPLTPAEQAAVTAARAADAKLSGWARVAHLPVCLITAVKP